MLPEDPGKRNHYPPQPYAEYPDFLSTYKSAEELSNEGLNPRTCRSLLHGYQSSVCRWLTGVTRKARASRHRRR
ncbi:hypothetical protein EMIT0347P_20240 [Pseudomonas sp. IT-347P]